MKKECKAIMPLMEDFCLGALPPGEAERVQGHLSRCPSCAQVEEETARLLALLNRDKDGWADPGEVFWEWMRMRIMEEVRRRGKDVSAARRIFRGFGTFFPRPAYAWATALLLLVFLPLFMIRLFDFSSNPPASSVAVLPRATEGDKTPWVSPPEPLPKVLASLTENESRRLAERMTLRLGRVLSSEEAPFSPAEEKAHWNIHRLLEGLEEEELEVLIKKLEPEKSAGLMEEQPYVC